MADHFPASNTARARHLTEAHPEIVQIPPGDYDLVLPLIHDIAHAAYERGLRDGE